MSKIKSIDQDGEISLNSFWFSSDFDEALKSLILKSQFSNASHSCLNESHRWAKLLLELGLDIDVTLNEGFYQVDGDPCHSEGHTWLDVDGSVFDPTAAQFQGDIDASNYEVHEYVDGEDLKIRLAEYGLKVTSKEPAPVTHRPKM